jgi:phosphatidylglycerol:prolipoprotein diacylglycerol transferase
MRYLVSKVNYIPKSVKIIFIDDIKYIQVHPTFLYESLWNLLSLILIMLLKKNIKNKFDGQIFLLYVIFYSFGRFWIESIRVDQLKLFNFAVSQILSAILFISAIIILIIKNNKQKISF